MGRTKPLKLSSRTAAFKSQQFFLLEDPEGSTKVTGRKSHQSEDLLFDMLLSQPRDELHETITCHGSARALPSNQAVVCRLHAECPAYLSSCLLTVSLSF